MTPLEKARNLEVRLFILAAEAERSRPGHPANRILLLSAQAARQAVRYQEGLSHEP